MIRAFRAAALAPVAAVAAASSATAAPPVGFACASSGEKLLAPPVSATAVCERLRGALSRESGLVLRLDGGASPAIRVTLRFTKAGVASARLTRAQGGRVTVHPEISIAVSDRAIDVAVVDGLAREVARAIDAGGKRR